MVKESHLHFCKFCGINIECWLDCGADYRDPINNKLLSGSLICIDCELEGKVDED